MERGTIGDALSSRDNGLNFVRLVLAGSVIVAHTWPLGGFGPHTLDALGALAVNGFFCISGYLIAGSRVRQGGGRFLWNRVLRIFPAFWVCLIVVAFGFAPLAAAISGDTWHLTSAVDYVRANGLLWIDAWGVEATLRSVPYPEAWNGSLWTLFYEFAAYLVAGLLLWPRIVRRWAPWVLGAALVGASVAIPLAHGPLEITTNLYLHALRLGACFVAGMFCWSVRDRLHSSTPLAVACAVAVAGLYVASGQWLSVLGPLPLAYLCLWAGANLPTRIGATNDVSYGVYIYAFPVQQLLATLEVQRWGIVTMMAAALLCTVPFAWASWQWIERPAMRLRNLGRQRSSVSVGHG